MEISLPLIDNAPKLLELVTTQLSKQFDLEPSKSLDSFLSQYLRGFPLEEWVGRGLNDLCGFLYGLWLEIQDRPKSKPFIRVFNPNLEENGWLCGRTVITVLQSDMPFLVDSIRIDLNRRDMPIHGIHSSVMNILSAEGTPHSFSDGQQPFAKEASNGLEQTKEALIYVEISLQTEASVLNEIKQSLLEILQDVTHAVQDYGPIKERLAQTLVNLKSKDTGKLDQLNPQQDSPLACQILRWLSESHFTFLGYREFDLIQDQGHAGLKENVNGRLGVFRGIDMADNFVAEAEFSEGAKEFYGSANLICYSKSSTRANVHRDVYPDYVVVKRFDQDGNVTGEVRFLGLFTYSVYSLSPRMIPLLKVKVDSLIELSGLDPNSHDGKNFIRVIDNFPKEQLFQADVESLYGQVKSIASINERHVVRLVMRKDPFGSFVNFLVYVPKEVYSTRIKLKIQKILGDALGSHECDSTSFFSESVLARAQFVFKVDPSFDLDIDEVALENAILDLTKNWEEYFQSGLIDAHGESRGIQLFNEFRHGFPQSYQETYDPRVAVADIDLVHALTGDQDVALHLYRRVGSDHDQLRFKVLRKHNPVGLSDVVPILENLGLRVLGESPFKICHSDGTDLWLHDFHLAFDLPVSLDVQTVKAQFEQAFEKIWSGECESDLFNRLVLAARISWREVCLLRCYEGYLKQTTFNSTREFIANTLIHHVEITRNLIALFKASFDPRLQKNEKGEEDRRERLKRRILDSLDDVSNLNEDLVLRRYLDLISGTLRTNYYQKSEGKEKSYIAIKFSPRDIPDIPEPRPMYEIYVYSPRVEGVHLRGGKVARGGLRWSDRNQDFRTEVLGLVKAQQVKNAVIVPSGAKGGFVAKQLRKGLTRDEFLAEGIACYKIFIKGLLDVTDNFIEGKIVPPADVVRHDDDDPYLVVAADKGTATFSDIANSISLEYGHWLGDAFASGGSQGYDHKGMGITAKGAWVSVQRHFREKGVNIQEEDFSVVGVGDMAGDVFGNGMLLSEHICLVGAFNHMHIFVDPSPNSAASFIERKRLFETPRTSWADYEKTLISEGGGVFERSAKSIRISPQMQKVFGIESSELTPNQLISAMLTAPVDLLWNGGIGTYVKASWESHAEVGDKANDILRVDGRDLRCQVFGEGGNLGMTQLGRVEFALNKGACNTDFIDNAAGVDCSDHEVNIKILLDEIVSNGDLTPKQRNSLLAEMTDAVSDLVLKNNYRQTFSISLAEFEASQRTNEYRRFITFLESEDRLDRALEFLPSDEEIVERMGKGKTLTRPELSVLISYAKVVLKDELINSDISADPYVVKEVETAFPKKIREQFPDKIYTHRLKREIVGTQVANDLINNLGITAAHRLSETTGADVADIATAYIVSRDVFRMESLQEEIQRLDNQVKAESQAIILSNMVRRVRRGTRWFLRNRRGGMDPKHEVETFRQGLSQVVGFASEHVKGTLKEDWFKRIGYFKELGMEQGWAEALSMPSNMFSGLGIVQASLHTDKPIEEVSIVFNVLLHELGLNWFATQLSDVNVETYWQALARESFIDDLEAQVRKITQSIIRLQGDRTLDETLSIWQGNNVYLINRWKTMVNEVQGSQVTDYAMFSVAIRELIDLAQATEHCERLDA